MTGKELFEKLLIDFIRIVPSTINLKYFQEIQETLKDFWIIDYFHQLKKNDKGDGLALEVMFFNNNLLHDIVLTRTNISFITIMTSGINMAYLETFYSENENEKGEISTIDKLKFTISYGGEFNRLVYNTDMKRFTELIRIRTNLLKIIIQ